MIHIAYQFDILWGCNFSACLFEWVVAHLIPINYLDNHLNLSSSSCTFDVSSSQHSEVIGCKS